MAASDLSLLFQLRADNAQAKAVMADTRQAVTQLRTQFGKDLTGMQGIAKTALADIGENLNAFVGQRIPLIGGAFLRVTTNLRGLNDELKKGGPQTKALAEQIDNIAKSSGKSSTEVSKFLTTFVRLEGQAARNNAAFKFFGGSIDQIGNKTAKFLPELEEAGTTLAGVATAAEGTGASMAAMAGPIGIAVIAIASLAIGAAAAAKQLFDLTKQAAEFQGRMFDLAQQTGLQVETLSALEVVAKTTGGEIGSISQAIVNFQRKLDDAQDPLSKTAEQFRKFQIATSDTETSLRQTFAALAAMPEGFAQTNAAAEFFGARGGKQVLAILKETGGDLDGTIDRFRELGILINDDAARSADRFNDELELLNFQTRALSAVLARDLIPAFGEAVKATGDLVRVLRPAVSILGTLTAPAVKIAGDSLKGLSIAIAAVTRDYKAMADAAIEAIKATQIQPIPIPSLGPVPLPGTPTPQQTSSEAVNQAEVVLAEIRRRVAAHNQALDSLFQQGRVSREKQANEIIEDNKRVLKADQDRIDAVLSKKEQELKALDQAQRDRGEAFNRDTDAYRAVTAEIVKLQQERLDKEAEFEASSKAIRARAAKERADAARNQIQNDTDLFTNEIDGQVKNIQAAVQRGTAAEEDGLKVIEALERARISARISGLERQKAIGFLTIEDQRDLNNALKSLAQEQAQLGTDQANRKLDRERATGRRAVDIALGSIETLLRLEQIAGQRRIDALQALADLRVISEEEAAKRILQIRLDLIDDEIEATKAKLKAAGAIADKDERIRAQADLNNQIKILTEERKTIQADGNRDLDEGRQRDLENERRYADELKEIRERVKETELDAAAEAIRLMQTQFARRKDIIRAQRDLELAEEDARHRRATESINRQKEEVDAEIKTLEKRLESLKIGTGEEIAQYERIIAALERLQLKRLELEKQQEAEDKRNQTRKRRVTKDSKTEEDESDPIGRFKIDIEQISRELENTIVPLGEVLRNTFQQVADAIGQVVANYVLLGETGPAVMRKILATALASIAAEAAVNAIKELALGFATLFFNPAESAAHFTAAGLWGAIAGGSALAGRAVAGDLFKSKSAGAGGSGSGANDRGQLDPLRLERNAGSREMVLKLVLEQHVKSNDSHIVTTVVRDIQSGGNIREVISNDGVLV